jgi:DDE superfamily endonuclease
MDSLTVAIQLARAAAFVSLSQQAAAQFMIIEDDEEDVVSRSRSVLHQRLHWAKFVRLNKDRPMFRRHMRMSHESFVKLLSMIKPHISNPDVRMGALRGGVILPELRLYATLRYLAGGSYTDICFFCGISTSMFYSSVWEVIHGINKAIRIKFPSSPLECAELAADFETVSHRGVFKNVVGAVDGYLMAIYTPHKKHANNVRSYFSGHYQRYGINVQACCDRHCRFTFLGIGGPGNSKDRQAVKESGLSALIDKLPTGYCCIADSAYQPTETLMTIFGGDLALVKDNDNYNYFASQLRIRIEMAFGLMTKKWSILQRPLSNSLPMLKYLICCIARLHNFCIDVRLDAAVTQTSRNRSPIERLSTIQLAYMNAAAQAEYSEIVSNEYAQWSLAREEMVQLVKKHQYTRPVANRRK